ncbi:hypothetical protein EFA46_015190 (plasmid) [Halarchaeum sp. CBA1220]|uniref:hypothetical protein n=1 Tax=Halarchaeum sp. CBA1220 TaxID=1853682 RepID=UPI000F3A97FE|nr:hypothetical protein [Halarchaeum sp. CBA1220]QLC35572.1 hypothetical protein EFA46_015190 [Halarchaeum sp. CBA1220]
MKATISPADPEATTSVTVEDEAVRVFCDHGRMYEVVAKRGEEVIPLGVQDAGVSREFDDAGEPGYVEFYREDDQLYVRDAGSGNGAVQRNAFGEIDLSDGEPSLLTGDCTIGLGNYIADLDVERTSRDQQYSTELHVEVERARRGTSAIPYKADLVEKISDVRPVDEVESEMKELVEMMRAADDRGERYQTLLEDMEKRLTALRQVTPDDPHESLTEQKHDDYSPEARRIANAARRVRNYYLERSNE